MTGLDKITSQIQEEAEASAKERLDAANKEAEQILADAQAACKVMEQEALEKAAAEKANQDGRAHSAAEQKRKTALLQTKQEIIAEVIGKAYETLKNEDTKSYFLTMEKLLNTYVLAESGEIYFSEADLARMPADFEQKIKAAAEAKGGKLVLKKEPKAIPDGFVLERFLFTPDMQYAPIGKLSGGEKRRLYLLGVLQQGPNVLVMDEVTNELDIPTLTILEDYLNSFIGIVILVSHDRYFLDNVSDRIFAFDGCGHFRQYEGGYTDYLESKNRENGGIAEKSSSKASAEVSGGKKKATWDKGEKKLKFSYKEQKEFETIDDDIAALEQKIEELDAEMAAHASQYSRLSELTEEKEKVQAELDEKMERSRIMSTPSSSARLHNFPTPSVKTSHTSSLSLP